MHLEKLFEQINSELLTDEVKLQMSTMFETALVEAVTAKETELDEQNRSEIVEFKESLNSQVDEYLNYMVEELMKEKDDTVEMATKVKTAEKVMEAFQSMLSDFNVAVSEDSISDSTQIDEMKAELNSKANELIEAKKELVLLQKKSVIAEKAQEFETDAAKEKFLTLAESVEFVDSETYSKKLDVIFESVKPVSETQQLDENDNTDVAGVIEEAARKEASTTAMAGYLKYFKK